MATLRFRLALTCSPTFLPAVLAEPAPARPEAAEEALPPGAVLRLGTRPFRLVGYTTGVALSPDGKLAAVSVQNSHVAFLDTLTGKETRRVCVVAANTGGLAFSPDGRLLAISSHGGLLLFDAVKGASLGQIDHRAVVNRQTPSFSADGKVLGLGGEGLGQKVSVSVWDVATRKQRATFAVPQDHWAAATLSADGKVLASWGQHLGRAGGGRLRGAGEGQPRPGAGRPGGAAGDRQGPGS